MPPTPPDTAPDSSAGETLFRLSPQQQRAVETGGTTRALFHVIGAEQPAIRRALAALVARHEILRTRLHRPPGVGTPLQAVGTGAELRLAELEHRDLASSRAELDRSPDPDGAAWSLARLEDGTHALGVLLPAWCADAATLALLADELAAQLSAGALSRVPDEPPVQYADASEILNELLEADDDGAEGDLWPPHIAAEAETGALPWENLHPVAAGDAPGRVRRRLDAALCRRLRAVASPGAESGACTDAAIDAWLLTAWRVLLGRLAGAGGAGFPPLAVPFDGRTHESLERAYGPYERFLPVDGPLPRRASFTDAVESTRRSLSELEPWQDYYPAQRPLGESAARGAARPVGFAVRRLPAVAGAGGGPRVRVLHQSPAADRFRLLLEVHPDADPQGEAKGEANGGAELRLVYDADRWRPAAAERLADAYVALIARTLDAPRRAVADLEVASVAEGSVRSAGAAGTVDPVPGPDLVHHLVAESARRHPRQPALLCDAGSLSHGELRRRAEAGAAVLRRHGAAPGRRVALAACRDADTLIALLAILRTGATLVPVDPEWPAPRLAAVAAQADPVLTVAGTPGLELPGRPTLSWTAVVAEAAEAAADRASEARPDTYSPDTAAYVLFTSGSTGQPKGVVVSHRALAHHLRWRQAAFPLGPGDRFLHKAALTFDIALWEVLAPLCAGAAVVLPPADAGADAAALVETMARHRVTVAHFGAALLDSVLAQPAAGELTALRLAFVGGESLTRDPARRFRERLPAARLHHQYGPTETTIDVTVHAVTDADLAPRGDGDGGPPLPLGTPVSGCRVHLLDDAQQPLPAGIRGEICVAGAGLARGYLGRPALTAERFLPDPASPVPGGRLYRTGDLARVDDAGHLRFLGRRDEQVKVRGFRVETGEVAAALAAHPAVRRAAVAVDGAAASERRLVAYLEPADGGAAPPALEELRAFLAARLPSFMLPALFVAVDELPLSRHGKVDRRRLPAPDRRNTLRPGTGYAAPRAPREELLCQIWGRVLDLPRVGIDDNYFHLGGDSIRILMVVHEAQRAGLPLRAGDLMHHQTVRHLAAFLDRGGDGGATAPPDLARAALAPAVRAALPAGDFVDVYPATPLQELMFRHSAAAPPAHGVYHVQSCIALGGAPARPDDLGRALAQVVTAHAPLRTRFLRGADGGLLQAVEADATPDLRLHDLRHLPAEEREAAVRATVRADLAQPYAVDDPGVPQRFHLFVEGDDAMRLLTSNHHAIRDGWSRVVLFNRVLDRYAEPPTGALGEGSPGGDETPRLDAYKELVALEREIAASPAARAFWRSALAPPAAPARRRSTASAAPPAPAVEELPGSLPRRLLERAGELGVTPRALCLAAWLELLSELTGDPVATTALVANGRSERLTDALGALGLYWNLVPFQQRRDGAGSGFDPAAVQRRLFDLEPHALYPFPKLLAGLGGGDAVFASFNYTQFHHERRRFAGGLTVAETHFHDRFHFPLNCVLSVRDGAAAPDGGTDGDGLRAAASTRVRLEYDDRYFTAAEVGRLLRRYRQLLAAVAGGDEPASARKGAGAWPAGEPASGPGAAGAVRTAP